MAQLTSKLPPLSDVTQFFGGQFFGRTSLPDVDFSGKVIIVTGGNGGLGFEAARHLYAWALPKIFTCDR